MPQGEYKVGEVIEMTYQSVGPTTGLVDVKMEIFDESGAKDAPNFPDVTMAEIGATGRYKGSFTPDETGKWRTMVDSVTKPGKVVKDYDVTSHNVASVGAKADETKVKLDTVDAKVDVIDDNIDDIGLAVGVVDSALGVVDGKVELVDAKIDSSELSIRGADSDTLKTLSDQIDGIVASQSGPMVG